MSAQTTSYQLADHPGRASADDGRTRKVDRVESFPEENAPKFGAAEAGTSNEQLDLATIVRVSELVSGEIVPDRLIRSLIKVAIEYGGAERGVLIMCEGKEPRIVSEATTHSADAVVPVRKGSTTRTGLPNSLLDFVMRTRERVILDDATLENPFSTDDYIRQTHPRSVLGLPLIKHGKLVALLYLESNRAPNLFTPERIAVLKFVALEAAISLENIRLYNELQEREAEVRRLVDANIIGVAIWTHDGHLVEANEAFVQIIGYTRDDVASGRIRWTDLTPQEWSGHDERSIADVMTKGVVQPFEKEYQRKDGSRVAVLIGCASLEDSENRGVVFVVDLTERKRAEAMLRKTKTELDHAMRVMTMGELGAIVHETNQPLTAIVTNASALLQWLDTTPPNLDRARETAEWILRDGEWAADVIRRLRALSRKTSGQKQPLDLNRSIEELLPLIQSEIRHGGIALTIQYAQGMLPVLGDRVQLQQVILNLIKNSIDAMVAVPDRPRELLLATGNHGGDSAGVVVRDTGSGATPDQLDDIFDSFYTTKPDGMGMGLSISRSIIQNHGGRLWATINQDFGMTFEFTIPAYKPTG